MNLDYRLLIPQDIELVEKFKKELSECKIFGFDFETSTQNANTWDENDATAGISFSFKPSEAYYLPIGHTNFGFNWDEPSLMQYLKPFFECTKRLKVAFNIKYERHWLKRSGINLSLPAFDPMLAINLLKKEYPHLGLKPNVQKIFNYSMLTFDEVVYYDGNKSRIFNDLDIDDNVINYACADSDWALKLVPVLQKQLEEVGMLELFNEIDVPLSFVLVDIEQNGWFVDVPYMKKLTAVAEKEIIKLEKSIFIEIKKQLRIPEDSQIIAPVGKTPKPFNINSTQHLSWLLFDMLKMPIIERTDKGSPAVNTATLQKLGKRFDIPIFNELLKYKKYKKILSTYLIGYRKHVRPNSRIHTTLDMVFVRTGRFSSSDPNLQNVSRADNDPLGVRNMFLAPDHKYSLSGEDSILIFSDYSQIELRIFAWYSGDPKMREAFLNGQDIHSRTAWEMYKLGEPYQINGEVFPGIAVEEVPKKAKIYRQYAKAINFGIIFGLGARGLAEDLWQKTDNDSLRMAQGLLDKYHQQYRAIRGYQEKVISKVRSLGYAETMFGRQRLNSDIQSREYGKRGYGERQALNTPIQGSASEIIKMAMVEIWKNRPKGLEMIMQIHDEIVCESPVSSLAENLKYIHKTMELDINGFDIPIIAECQIGLRWGDKKDIVFTPDGKVKVLLKDSDTELIKRLEKSSLVLEVC